MTPAAKASRGKIRTITGMALAIVLAVMNPVMHVVIILGIATGIWWPIIKAIMDSPVAALWLIPLGLLLSGLAAFIQQFIYNILIFPLAVLTGWLLKQRS